MTTTYEDLGSLDDWLLSQGIEQAERGVSIEDQLIPPTVERLGLPLVYLYATAIFDGEVANGSLQQFFDNSSGALAPTVRDALQEIQLPQYASIMKKIIDAFGVTFPHAQWDRMDQIDNDPTLQNLLDVGSDAIDVWSREFVLARDTYARKHHLLN